MTNLTDWIDGLLKPVHVGVYQRMYPQTPCGLKPMYSYWDGEFWYMNAENVDQARTSPLRSAYTLLDWRGLDADPRAFTPDSKYALAA